MKISFAISILILVCAAFIGRANKYRLESLRETHGKLVAEAAALGISIDLQNPDAVALVTKRAREDKDAEARAAAKELLEFAKEMGDFKDGSKEPDDKAQERIVEMMDLMLSLDASQMKILIAEFRKATDLDEQSKNGMIAFAIMTLASDHPQAALSLFTESGDLLGDGMMGAHVLSSSLASWASTDPDGALEWVRQNGEKHPDLITDNVKAGLIKGAATKDMKLAFDLIAELKMARSSEALGGIAQGAKTPEERSEFIKLMRAYKETNPDGEGGMAMYHLADGIASDGFENSSKWIAEQKLSEEEIEDFASSIANNAKGAERGQWISWMGENLSGDNRNNEVSSAMQNWTRTDYRAAGEWLATEPEGPTKTASVKGYVEAVAKYDPQTATQWALTLPEGSGREDSLRAIHSNMASETPDEKAARQEFKEQYGIK